MLAELMIIPPGRGQHISAIAGHRDGWLPYQLTPSGTCIEGNWRQDGGQKAPRKKK